VNFTVIWHFVQSACELTDIFVPGVGGRWKCNICADNTIGTTLQNLVARASRLPGFVPPWD